jgi:DNA-binding response OmpR family regulator
MSNILLLGREDVLAPYAAALTRDGTFPVLREPGAVDPVPENISIAVLDLPSLAEDPAAKALLSAHDGTPLIVVAGSEQLAAFDPIRDVDEFVIEGCPPEELVARVRRILWKRERVDARNILRCGDLVMDLAGYTVHLAGKPVSLTYKEYELLRFLATNRDRVFSRETLLSKVWGYDFYGGARTVDVHIRRLRSKIEDRNRTFIETVRNVGYRFISSP